MKTKFATRIYCRAEAQFVFVLSPVDVMWRHEDGGSWRAAANLTRLGESKPFEYFDGIGNTLDAAVAGLVTALLASMGEESDVTYELAGPPDS